MHTTSFEAKSCSVHDPIHDARRLAPLETYSLTAAVTGLCVDAHGRRFARLNAFVDGLGQRSVHVELEEAEVELAMRALTKLGALIRGSGELVMDGPRLLLRPGLRLELLEPHDDPR